MVAEELLRLVDPVSDPELRLERLSDPLWPRPLPVVDPWPEDVCPESGPGVDPCPEDGVDDPWSVPAEEPSGKVRPVFVGSTGTGRVRTGLIPAPGTGRVRPAATGVVGVGTPVVPWLPWPVVVGGGVD